MSDPVFLMYAFYAFIIGLCVGSFLNVASLRALKGEEIVVTPSHCPKCGKDLKWYHNIPLFSYIFLGGKCGFCKEKISPQYPFVEFINGFLYLAIFLIYGISFKTLFLCILVSFFVLITITDIKERVVFDFHTYPVVILGLLYNIFKIGDCGI
jgi:leader peptidase (prepilin peptidase)/N-methyltransferase